MSESRDIELIDELRAFAAETSWVEFKVNNIDPDVIGKRCSALSNSARLEGRDCAYMLCVVSRMAATPSLAPTLILIPGR